MACRTVAKTSLVHRFTQVLLNSAEGAKEERPAPASPKLKSRRLKLEKDVERLRERLQQQEDLHSALENAIAHAAGAFPRFPRNLPVEAQEFLAEIAALEVAVSNLEEQMIGLKMQIRHEHSERLQHATYHRAPPILSREKVLQESSIMLPYKARDPVGELSPCESKSKGWTEQVCGPQCSNTFSQDVTLSNSSLPYASTSEITILEEENMEYKQVSKVVPYSTFSSDEESTISRLPAKSARGSLRGSDAERMGLLSQPVTPHKDSKYGSQRSMAKDSSHISRGVFEEDLSHTAMGESNPLDSKYGSQRSMAKDSIHLSRGVFEEDLSHTAMGEANPLGNIRGQLSLIRDPKLNDKWHEKLRSLESVSLWRQPSRLSQEMVSCMIGIYCHLADPSEVICRPRGSESVPSPNSPFGHGTSSSFSSLSELSSLSFARSPPFELRNKEELGAESSFDPYCTHGKLPWADIGSYSSAVEVSWMSVGKEQLEYAADALRIFKSLVEQLSKVDVASLGPQEKLAFWINVYNALMMHAYLAYGVPTNDVKFFALIQKAAYTVGGHFFNAMTIEHVLLKGKAPSYRPQIALLLALQKVKIPDGASKFAISRPEPLVTFALSCGACSSPAVRIYTAENVHAQLQTALHDYVRASVGVTEHGKVLVPKLLHSYAQDVIQVGADWLCGFLPAQQATIVRDALQQQQRRRGFALTAVNIAVVPFDSRLRYLFLVDDQSDKM